MAWSVFLAILAFSPELLSWPSGLGCPGLTFMPSSRKWTQLAWSGQDFCPGLLAWPGLVFGLGIQDWSSGLASPGLVWPLAWLMDLACTNLAWLGPLP